MRNVRFGVNFRKRCRTTAAELMSARAELLSPYLIFQSDNKSFAHALPVIVKPAGEVKWLNVTFSSAYKVLSD